MHKIFDNIFAGLMLAAGVAVVLAGTWVLSHSIEQARREPPPARAAQTVPSRRIGPSALRRSGADALAGSG